MEGEGGSAAHQAGGSASSHSCPPPPGFDSRLLSLCRSFANRCGLEREKKEAELKINTAFFRTSPTASSAEAQGRSINLIKREF